MDEIPSSTASNATVESIEEDVQAKRESNDVGWKYGFLPDASNKDKVKCKLCNKVVSGGIFRFKCQIANIKGNVVGCMKSTKEDSHMQSCDRRRKS
ncbi:hypothetical protein ACHQM5_024096 [Ranunculus cassubicifolius]